MNDFYKQNLPIEKPSVEDHHHQKDIMEENATLKMQVENFKNENAKLSEENTKLRKDLASLLKVHRETCRMYVNKELKVKLFQKHNVAQDLSQNPVLFDQFTKDLGEDVLKKLRSIGGSKRADSTFILHCMRKLFENKNELQNMSASGTDRKKMIPKNKRDVLDRIFLERLSSEKLDDVEMNERYLCMNRLINVAIGNILRKKVNQSFNNG